MDPPDRKDVVAQVVVFGKLTMMSVRPDRIAPARWTGVEATAATFGSLSFFLGSLAEIVNSARNAHLK